MTQPILSTTGPSDPDLLFTTGPSDPGLLSTTGQTCLAVGYYIYRLAIQVGNYLLLARCPDLLSTTGPSDHGLLSTTGPSDPEVVSININWKEGSGETQRVIV